MAAKGLGKIENAKAIAKAAAPPLIRLLNDDDWKVRLAAVDALGNVRIAKAILPLIEALNDGNAYVRGDAGRTLCLYAYTGYAVLPVLRRKAARAEIGENRTFMEGIMEEIQLQIKEFQEDLPFFRKVRKGLRTGSGNYGGYDGDMVERQIKQRVRAIRANPL